MRRAIARAACVWTGLVAARAAALAGQAAPAWHQRAWVTGGVGAATGGGAATAGGGYSIGRLVLLARADWAGDLHGDQIADRAGLVGWRSGTTAWFATGAIGFARARSYTTCECAQPVSTRPDVTASAFAFEAKAFTGVSVSQVGLSIYGVVGARRISYVASVLSVNFGWFGH